MQSFQEGESLLELNITYNRNRRKKFHIAEYLGFYLDADLIGKSMALKSLQKINAKLKFLYKPNELLNSKLHRLL